MTAHTLDATGKSLGRVASAAASLLMGKNSTEFARNRAPKVVVEIVNAGKVAVSEKKKRDNKYVSYSGYPGGLKTESVGHLAARRGMKAVLRETVAGMLPKNKLKRQMLLNLKISE